MEAGESQWSLAESRINLGRAYLTAERHGDALGQLERAAPVMRNRAADGADAQAQLVSLMTDSLRAWALFRLDRLDSAEPELRRVVDELESLAANYDNLQARYTLATARVRLAAVRVALAETSSARAERSERWRQAQTLLRSGVAVLEDIDKAVPFDSQDRVELDLGKSLLRRSEAEARQ